MAYSIPVTTKNVNLFLSHYSENLQNVMTEFLHFFLAPYEDPATINIILEFVAAIFGGYQRFLRQERKYFSLPNRHYKHCYICLSTFSMGRCMVI